MRTVKKIFLGSSHFFEVTLMGKVNLYVPHILRVNLSTGEIKRETKSSEWARKYMGGMGFGTRILWEELPPETAWNSPNNKIIFSLGTLTGTNIAASGLCCVNTIGPLSNGLCSAQTLGHFGATLRRAGTDILIIEGESKDWKYLYIEKGKAELRSAAHIVGLDTWETDDALKEEMKLPGRKSSIACIGPAGEHEVRFAGVFNDKGHLASSNGPGAVLGHKKLKAIFVKRADEGVSVYDPKALDAARIDWFDAANTETASGKSKTSGTRYVGTLGSLNMMNMAHLLPVKNYLSTSFPTCSEFNRDRLEEDPRFKWVRTPCWACPWNHCHSLEIVDGKYKGMVGDEPEYEGMSAMSALIGNFDDTAGGLAMSIVIDHLGMDLKEGSFVLAMVYECYSKGIITKEDLGGLEMNWGDCDAGMELLRKIAYREGIGDVLAEGVMRAAKKIGKGADDCAVYTKQGFAPHIHDQRSQWSRIPGFGMSDYGSNLMNPVEGFVDKDNFGIEKPAQAFNMEEIAEHYVLAAAHRPVDDSLGVCMFYTQADWRRVMPALNAATGWDYTVNEAKEFGYRMVALMRCLNMRNGIRVSDYGISKRWMTAPVEGEWKQPKIADETLVKRMFEKIEEGLGWDTVTGCPTKETLDKLGLSDVAEVMKTIDFTTTNKAVREA